MALTTQPLVPISAKKFQNQLLSWYRQQGRHHLPWKKPLSPYGVWLSEIMLQQTQVATVIPYYHQFIKTFPTIQKLSEAPLDQVLLLWSGLGYYSRARNLHKTAQYLVQHYQGKFPQTVEELQALPGIGRSTAGAILSQAFNQFAPILDGNVKRVLSRFHCIEGWKGEKVVEKQLWELAEHYSSRQFPADYTQAIMDLGATCCTRAQPTCTVCPLQKQCLAFKRGEQHLYPAKKTRKTLPHREVIMLLIYTHDDHILLEQRPLKGIWAGLWSLPEWENEQEAKRFLKNTLGLKRIHLKELPRFKHTFTHFHLHIQPLFVGLTQKKSLSSGSSLRWISASDLPNKGLPSPIKKLLKGVQHANGILS